MPMTMDYEKMTDEELGNELASLEENFNEYKHLFAEVYENMSALSEKYNNIQEILNNRNGK